MLHINGENMLLSESKSPTKMSSSTQSIFSTGAAVLLMAIGIHPFVADGKASTTPGAIKKQNIGDLSPGKKYQIVSRLSGKCIDVSDQTVDEGIQLQQSNCNGKAGQKFQMLRAHGEGELVEDYAIYLVSPISNQYITVADGSLTNGGLIIQYASYAGNAPRINLTPSHDGSFTIKFASSGKCLDIEGQRLDAGAMLQQQDCLGEESQDWQFVEQTDGLGQKAWTLATSSLFRDAQKGIYRQSFTDDVMILSAVDSDTGSDRWSRSFPTYESFYPLCSDAYHFYAFGNGTITAINPKDGTTLWTFDSNDTSTQLSCMDGKGPLFVISHTGNGEISKIDRASGKRLWAYTAQGPASVQGQQGQNVLLTVSLKETSSLLAVDTNTGKEKWSRQWADSEYLSLVPGLDVTIVGKNSVAKLDPDTGHELWTYEGDGKNRLSLEWNEKSLFYVRQGSEIRRLSDTDGSVLWARAARQNEFHWNSYITTLQSGEVLVSMSDKLANQTRATLYEADGATLWETAFEAVNAVPNLDSSGKLFFRTEDSLIAIDISSGAVRWSFAREQPIADEHLYTFETFGSDVYLTYGTKPALYPAMGIIRLDAKTGALQWDVWTGESTSLIGVDRGLLLTRKVMDTGINSYKI